MVVKVLSENTEHGVFKGEHGLSLFVEFKNKNYIVDTGSSDLFAKNAELMGVDLSSVEKAFLSHAHYDHSTGFPVFFEKNSQAKVYLQSECKNKCYFKIIGPLKKYIGVPENMFDQYPDRFEFVDGYRQIDDGIYVLPHTTGNLEERGKKAHMCTVVNGKIETDDFSHEQTIVFDDDGLVCFNSCSHGGVENIIEEVKAAFPGKKIKAFFGGFHMMGAMGVTTCSMEKNEVTEVANKIMKSSDAVFFSGHCTGIIAYEWLEEVLGERIVAFHAGKEIKI